MPRVSGLALLLFVAMALAMGGCAIAPINDVAQLEPPANYQTPVHFAAAGKALQGQCDGQVGHKQADHQHKGQRPNNHACEQAWWHGFQDPQLNALVTQALSHNLDIAIAMQNVARSRHLHRAAGADLLPSFSAFVDGEFSKAFRSESGDEGSDFSARAGGNLSYEFSFGKRNYYAQRVTAANLQQSKLNALDLQRLTVAAVVERYIEARRAVVNLALLETNLAAQRQALSLVEAKVQAGIAPTLDAERIRVELALAEATRGPAQANFRRAQYALAVLLGQAPNVAHLSMQAEPAAIRYTAGPAITGPADLLRRRADVRAAEQAFIAAANAVGVQRADLYPTLGLMADIPLLTASTSSGLDTVLAALSAALDLTIFDGGRRQAQVAAQQAEANAALLRLRKSWLTALSEVENALLQIKALHLQRQQLTVAATTSESSYQRLTALYQEGLTDLINVLDAQRSLITTRQALVSAEADYALAVTALYTSLGADGPRQ